MICMPTMDIIDGLTRKLWQLRKPSEGMSDDERTKQTKQAELSSIKMAMSKRSSGDDALHNPIDLALPTNYLPRST